MRITVTALVIFVYALVEIYRFVSGQHMPCSYQLLENHFMSSMRTSLNSICAVILNE